MNAMINVNYVMMIYKKNVLFVIMNIMRKLIKKKNTKYV